ncbi:helix-turn-helix domain-containing protein [Candidatus Omnitrophota bacterium]
MDKLLTPQQLSELLQVKPSTVYKWTHYRYIPYVKLGTAIRFRAAKIEEWIKKREKRGRHSYKIPFKL